MNSTEKLSVINLQMNNCNKNNCLLLPAEALNVIQENGGRFLNLATHEPCINPESRINKDGMIFCGFYLQHHTLVPDDATASWWERLGLSPGSTSAAPFCTFSFLGDRASVAVSQGATPIDKYGVHPDRVALGLVRFTLFWSKHLYPKYSSIDELGQNAPRPIDLQRYRLTYLYWANFFNSEWVAVIGRDLFETVPGGNIVELEDGGILYLVTEKFTEWRANEYPEIVKHFRRKFPRLKRYRPDVYPT